MTELIGAATVDDGTLKVMITLDDAGDKAGLFFSKDASGSVRYYAVTITTGAANNVNLQEFSSTWGTTDLATASATINADTEYTVRVRPVQRRVEFEVLNSGGTVLGSGSYEYDAGFGEGAFGLLSHNTNVKFDDFTFTRVDVGQSNLLDTQRTLRV